MKKACLLLSVAVIATITLTAWLGGHSSNQTSNNFKEVKIGNQIWMAENLNVEKFRNGDPIPEAKTDDEWKAAGKNKQPAWCYYDNDPINGEEFGKLYNWYAVNDPRGLAPEGWRMPSDADWTQLTNFLGGEDVAGDKLKSNSGFSAFPGGGFRDDYGNFSFLRRYGKWWNATEYNTDSAWFRDVEMGFDSSDVFRNNGSKVSGFSVRCIMD